MPHRRSANVTVGRLLFVVAAGLLGIVLLLALVSLADSTVIGWDVDYFTAGGVDQARTFYGDGVYQFLRGPDYTAVYLHDESWIFIGMYAVPFGAYAAAELPDTLPVIAFPLDADRAIAVPRLSVQPSVTPVPEPPAHVFAAMTLLAAVMLVGLRMRRSW